MRSSWDQTWLQVAKTIAQRSKCVNRQVGAVIVDQNNRPVSVGYNGPAANFPAGSKCSEFCPRGGSQNRPGSYDNCVSVHAEANALLFADRRLFEAATIYITNPCCWECAKLISNSGISRVVMESSNQDSHADWSKQLDLLDKCQIGVVIIEREQQ